MGIKDIRMNITGFSDKRVDAIKLLEIQFTQEIRRIISQPETNFRPHQRLGPVSPFQKQRERTWNQTAPT